MEAIRSTLEKFISDDYLHQAILAAKDTYLQQCQKEDNAHAYFQLGQFYYQDWSNGHIPDLANALDYFQKASDLYHPVASYMLYVLLDSHEEEVEKLHGHLQESDLMLKRGKLCLKAAAYGRRSSNAHKEITYTIVHYNSWRATYLKILEEYQQMIENNVANQDYGQLYNVTAYLLWMTNEDRDLQIYKQAIHYFKIASSQYHHPAGYYNLADWALAAYANITGDDVDEEMTECMKLAGQYGHPLALYHLANESNNPASDANQRNIQMRDYLLRSSSTIGYAETLVCLGCLYLHGITNGQSDFKLAKRYFEQACLAPSYEASHWIGSHWAFHQLAYIFEKGLDDRVHYDIAASLYAQAGLLKNYHSFCKLAKLIEKNKLVESDISIAIQLYQDAVDHDEDTAGYGNYRLGKIYLKYDNYRDITKSKRCFRLAYKFYKSEIELCANAGHYYRLGLMHHYGYGVTCDQTKASKLYQKCIYEASSSHNLSVKHYRQKAIHKLNVIFDDEHFNQTSLQHDAMGMQSMAGSTTFHPFNDPLWQDQYGLQQQVAVFQENETLKKRMSQMEEALQHMKKRLTLSDSDFHPDPQQVPICNQSIAEEPLSPNSNNPETPDDDQQAMDDVFVNGVKLRKKKAKDSKANNTNHNTSSQPSPTEPSTLATENQELKQENRRLTLEVSTLREQVSRLSVIINKSAKETDL